MCVESYTQDDEGMYWYLPALTESPHRVYCRVLRRTNRGDDEDADDDDEEEPLYMVEMDLPDSKIVVQDVDSDGIFLYDKAYSADWHLPNVFRHEIMIPDDIMPPAWLNGPGYDPQQEFDDDDEEDDEEE